METKIKMLNIRTNRLGSGVTQSYNIGMWNKILTGARRDENN